jgi:hypothetical protein
VRSSNPWINSAGAESLALLIQADVADFSDPLQRELLLKEISA